MRTIIVLNLLLAATAAFAHPGHVGEVSGHTHYIAFGLITMAALIVLALLPTAVRIHRARLAKRRAR
ncbi:DUF6732 family protein [Acuticoccus mangrovi]|uniref:Uncharacterized protein n=1 Tax=Acuticoccus mangrovi TaxID=2796142 RepID=A0A934INV9_9HYPH|nr:DUF6732 family protein [Acuticoccus mangrovi]MBJ3777317.1 hypothetical protein [Acuticoccus mangrovi]